jgi:hypothetical protein
MLFLLARSDSALPLRRGRQRFVIALLGDA